jgi:TatD DNase family protein
MGEIGLDKAVDKDFSLQKEVFIRQLEFAAGQGLICIIHCVRAFSEILSLRKKFCDSPPWIIHDFNSSPQMAADFIRRGCYLSFGKRIMQKNNRAYRCLRELPDNAGFFLETDVRNNYSIMDIYYAAAQIRRLDISKLRNKIIDNFQNCFKEYPCLMNG